MIELTHIRHPNNLFIYFSFSFYYYYKNHFNICAGQIVLYLHFQKPINVTSCVHLIICENVTHCVFFSTKSVTLILNVIDIR